MKTLMGQDDDEMVIMLNGHARASIIHIHDIFSRQRLVEVSLSSGNYSRLLADVIFTRSMGYYMIQVIWGYFRILHDTGSFWIFRDII